MIKYLVLFLIALTCRAQITDLGVVTDQTLIQLHKCERRKDFVLFKVEMFPKGETNKLWTNRIILTTTNDFLSFDDLSPLPEGVSILAVKSMCSDQTFSRASLFTIDLQRRPPSPPKASILHLLPKTEPEPSVEEKLDLNVITPSPTPPLPPMEVSFTTSPLPGGTNESYSEYQSRIQQALQEGRRRGQ